MKRILLKPSQRHRPELAEGSILPRKWYFEFITEATAQEHPNIALAM
jgi:hypothetical protein